jgi:UDP-N-acetylglucosamine 4,6-dehydratase
MEIVLKNKKILVTGGTGSIGRMIVYELLKHEPSVIRILDIDETREASMQNYLKQHSNVRFLIGDIRDKDRLLRAMEDIDIVFHTASFKHVLSCEYNPFEAVKTNVIGTQNLIDAAINEEVEKFVFTSSDKAVNPTNVMGATKLLAERLVTAANYYKGARKTIFFSVRFGNVLGSRGSVVHLFKKQIQKGGPLTITDPKMTRFVMSTSEAVRLLFKSMELAQGGEIFIFKMPSVKILDMCQVMLEQCASDVKCKTGSIEIKMIGRKPGEKLYEELITQSEAERSLETKDMFIVLPEVKENLKIDTTLFPKAKPAKIASYTSDTESLLSRAKTKKLLHECNVIEAS